jgi:hypothetical protein
MYFVRSVGLGRVAPVLTAATVAMVLLSGCQTDPDPAATQTAGQPSSSSSPASTDASASASASASAPASSEPSPASSAGPAANLPVPVKPALADENSAEGLEAFTKYWFELFSYGYETNDWVPFEAVTDPGCGTCTNVVAAVKRVYESGGWVVGAKSDITGYSTDFRANTQGSVSSFVEVVQGRTATFAGPGELRGDDPKKPPSTNVTFTLFDQDKWLMLDFGPPEGTG